MDMGSRKFLGLGAHGFHALAYAEWGAANTTQFHGTTVVCVHGLTRNGRDFDFLARALADDRRVVCPDVAGRGRSAWLAVAADYGYPQYLADMNALIARLAVEAVDWVGTSMGGLIGMMLAAQPGSPIRRLVINDIGPFIPKAAVERIASYVGADPRFPGLAETEAYLREIYASFGDLDDAQWRHLTEHSVRQADDGLALAYDPAIAVPFKGEGLEDVVLWPVWEAVRCPVLVLRGAESDVLSAETAERMAKSGPKAEVRTITGCGHAPALMDARQIAIVRDWLSATG